MNTGVSQKLCPALKSARRANEYHILYTLPSSITAGASSSASPPTSPSRTGDGSGTQVVPCKEARAIDSRLPFCRAAKNMRVPVSEVPPSEGDDCGSTDGKSRL